MEYIRTNIIGILVVVVGLLVVTNIVTFAQVNSLKKEVVSDEWIAWVQSSIENPDTSNLASASHTHRTNTIDTSNLASKTHTHNFSLTNHTHTHRHSEYATSGQVSRIGADLWEHERCNPKYSFSCH